MQKVRGKLKEGDLAPDFELLSQDGKKITLHEFRGSKNVVLYFYPKDFTHGCSAETKLFGENYDEIRSLGAEVLGVSRDSVESHKEFADDCKANFLLLSDEGGRVGELYGVTLSFGLIPGRTTFVIDRQGIVRHVFSSQLAFKKHVAEALKALKALAAAN
jgi:thioredoxin-dependent peroxiredoxin